MAENYLINPVNPWERLTIPTHQTRNWRDPDGTFRVHRRKKLKLSPFKLKNALKRKKKTAKICIHTSRRNAKKSHTRRNSISPLLLINKMKRRKSRKKMSFKKFSPLKMFHFNAKKRRSHRKYRRNPNVMGMIKKMGTHSAIPEVFSYGLFGAGGLAASMYATTMIQEKLPNVAFVQTPIGKIVVRLLAASALYQLRFVKPLSKFAPMIAGAAVLPAVFDIAGMLGFKRVSYIGTDGVGMLPSEYRGGMISYVPPAQRMGVITPEQNAGQSMAGSDGEGSW